MSESPRETALEPIVVHKYGGSSVASAEHIRKVAKRVVLARESGKSVVVVVSAMAKTTDELLAQAKEISQVPSRRELDMLLSCGERASMALLAMAVTELGHSAVSLTGSQSGIMTNDRHSGARIIDVRPIRVLDELHRGNIVIVAGFQGVSYKREITTLGRGGSDTTAVALAGALRAEYCEICSDVEGVFTADPRVVSGATLLEAIRADEMLELASHGARVLHAGCVEMAVLADIRLQAVATSKVEGSGTRIDGVGQPGRTLPVGVTAQKGLARLRQARLSTLLGAANEAQVPVFCIDGPLSDPSLFLALDDVPDWKAIYDRWTQSGLIVDEGLAAVSVVRAGLGRDPGWLHRVVTLASDCAEPLCATSSALRITLFVEEAKADELTRHLHAALFDTCAHHS